MSFQFESVLRLRTMYAMFLVKSGFLNKVHVQLSVELSLFGALTLASARSSSVPCMNYWMWFDKSAASFQ